MVFLMLSACASAFSQVGRRSNVQHNSALRRNPTVFYTNSQSSLENESTVTTSTTQLQFRDGDDEDTMTRRQEHDAAAAASSSSPSSPQRHWWQTVFPPDVPAELVDSEQEIVDDYLKFLDRRYHRLHDDVERKEAKFSAWSWLMQGNEGSEDQVIGTQAEKEDDALYVLGVAGLASQRLLQKHHPAAPTQKSTAKMSVDRSLPSFAVDAEMTVLPSSRLSVVASIAIARATPILHRVLQQRRALLLFESVKSQAVLKFLVRKVAVAPFKAMKSAVELGGGKQNIAMTLTVATALSFVILRPVAQAVISKKRP
jgi:hypothetical protein